MITTIPLTFSPNQRGPIITSSSAPTQDARMVRCFNTLFPNRIKRDSPLYCEKIPGWATSTTPGGSNSGTAFFVSPASDSSYSAFGSNSTIYRGTTDVGSTSGAVCRFTIGSLSGVETIFFSTTFNEHWYLPSGDGNINTTAYTADGNNSTTITDIKITGVNSTAGLYPGQLLAAATNIVAGSRIVSVDSGAFTAVLDTATTGGAFNDLAITKTRIANITDADFAAYDASGDLVEMDGYVFAAVLSSGIPGIANSNLNSATAWTAGNFAPLHIYDNPSTIAIYRDHVVFLGYKSLQFFYNAGNASGSILSQNDNLTINGIGCAGALATGLSFSTTVGDALYWLGVTGGVISGIYRLNGFSPEKISNDAVTRQLAAVIPAVSSTTIIAFDGFSMFGQDFLYVGVGDIGYLYCVQSNTWVEAGFFSGGMRIAGNTGSSANPALYGVRMTGATGKIYVMSETALTYQDDTAAYSMVVQGEKNNLGTGGWKQIQSFELIADTQASGTTLLEITNDDYATWQTIGTFDMTAQRKIIDCGGGYYGEIAPRLTHSANTAWRGQGLIVEHT